MKSTKDEIAQEVSDKLGSTVDVHDIETPPVHHAAYAYPVMQEASDRDRDPMRLAKETASGLDLSNMSHVESVSTAPPGYLNFELDWSSYGNRLLQQAPIAPEEKDAKVVVEHTSPNPNKPLHMGTMRCAVLGDSIARLADYSGFDVEVQNFMNDLGRQIAKVTYGYDHLRSQLSEEELQQKDDFWIGLLYSKTGNYIEQNPNGEDKVDHYIQQIEAGDTHEAELKDELVSKALKGQLQTAYRSNTFYGLLVFERSIVESGMFEEAMEKIRTLDRVYEVEEGEDEGCVVIDISDQNQLGNLQKPYKVLQRSDGTAVYTAKDIALTMWKFGLLDSEFQCGVFDQQPNGEAVWTTDGDTERQFGNASEVINVVGTRQSYPMHVIEASLNALGYEEEAESFHHAGFKFVYLPGKVSYSGREGNWVGKHGDAVLDKCRELALEEVQGRHENLEPDAQEEIAEKVAVAAVRYFLLRFSRDSDIDFSFEKALDWQGDSGPYLLYTAARAHGILDKVDAKPEFSSVETDVEKELVRQLGELQTIAESAYEARDPVKVAQYAKRLAENFNTFYHDCPVKGAGTHEVKSSRIALTKTYTQVFGQALGMLGIETTQKM
nr:MAG: arginyl-tRNA synthetase [Candidatus Nanosalinarum sp. J07AB56]